MPVAHPSSRGAPSADALGEKSEATCSLILLKDIYLHICTLFEGRNEKGREREKEIAQLPFLIPLPNACKHHACA